MRANFKMEQPSALRCNHKLTMETWKKKKVFFIRKVVGYKEKHEAATSVIFWGVFI